MHLEYQALIQRDPELEARLRLLPGATFSGRKRPAKGLLGVFFCYALPSLDKELGEFTEAAGVTRWYFCDLGGTPFSKNRAKLSQAFVRRRTPREAARQSSGPSSS